MDISSLIAQMLIGATPGQQQGQTQNTASPEMLGPEGTVFRSAGSLVELQKKMRQAYLAGDYDTGDRIQQMINQMANQMQQNTPRI